MFVAFTALINIFALSNVRLHSWVSSLPSILTSIPGIDYLDKGVQIYLAIQPRHLWYSGCVHDRGASERASTPSGLP